MDTLSSAIEAAKAGYSHSKGFTRTAEAILGRAYYNELVARFKAPGNRKGATRLYKELFAEIADDFDRTRFSSNGIVREFNVLAFCRRAKFGIKIISAV